jgi:FkbM family methyltransferase
MRTKNTTSIFTGGYNLARKFDLLEMKWCRRAFVTAYFLYKKLYEDPFAGLVSRMPELFRNGDVLDVGANIGYTACLFARALGPGCKVYAFEPDQSSHDLLVETIRRKRLSGSIEASNLAVGSSDSTVEFWHNQAHSADHRVMTDEFRAVQSDSAQTTTVAMTSLDSFVRARNLKKISFIKIDVQGYELPVCEGMRATLETFPAIPVCFEYSPDGLRELGFDPEALLNFFRSRSYQMYVLTRDGLQPAACGSSLERALEKAGYVDLICSRQALL